MAFEIDPATYRVVDLSYLVEPNQGGERPFVIERGLLADGAFKHDVKQTHSHVGTHVESPAHFFEHGKDVTELPLATYYGRAVLLEVAGLDHAGLIMPDYLEQDIGPILKHGDIVIARNNDVAAGAGNAQGNPCFTPAAATWLRDHEIKMLGIDNNVGLATDVETAREVHDILMSRDVVFVEWLDNLHELRRKEFFFMALPYKVRVMDSSWARAIAIEEC